MIKIIKLSTGENILGDVQQKETAQSGEVSYTVVEPMYIDAEDGGMKLRDGLILTLDISLSFRSTDIITMSTPVNSLEVFYHKTVEYYRKYGRPYALEQIKDAIANIEATMQEDEKRKNHLINILSSSNNVTSIH